jgi:hypothetical protein
MAPISEPSRKSPAKGFLYSVVLPGAGHLYAGEKRGFAHLGMEVLTWASYLYYHDRGKAKEDEFEAYADAHWDYDRWLASEGGKWVGSPQDSILRYFAEHNRQQYYEEIGKLSPYWSGWDDWNAATGDGYNRNYYRGIRAHSNNFLRNARYAVAGGFVNRAVSAVDVLRILKLRNGTTIGRDTKLRFKVRAKPFAPENAIGFELTKRL